MGLALLLGRTGAGGQLSRFSGPKMADRLIDPPGKPPLALAGARVHSVVVPQPENLALRIPVRRLDAGISDANPHQEARSDAVRGRSRTFRWR